MWIVFWGLNCLNILFPLCLYGTFFLSNFVEFIIVEILKSIKNVFKLAFINQRSEDFKLLQMQKVKFILAALLLLWLMESFFVGVNAESLKEFSSSLGNLLNSDLSDILLMFDFEEE